MKKIQYLLSFAIILLTVSPAFAVDQVSLSSKIGQDAKYDVATDYQFTLKHRDGTILPLNLVRFNKAECVYENGVVIGCVGGFTNHQSNTTRKNDPEHPVDTTEIINLTYTSGKVPIVDEESLLHEIFHAVDYHYNSRSFCEANWRYAECMETKAYGYTFVVKQIKDLQRKGKIKLKSI